MADITIGTYTFQCITDLETALQYVTGSISEGAAVWLAGDDEFQGRTLISAQRIFDRLPWIGSVTVEGQPNSWPRTGIPGVVDDTITPEPIIFGLIELAMLLAQDSEIANTTNSGSNVKRAKGGDAEVWFFRNTEDSSSILPASAYLWIKQFLDQGIGIGAADFGTYSEEPFKSVFDDEAAMQREKGLM